MEQHVSDEVLIARTRAYAKAYMSQSHFDASHNYSHILRVLSLSTQILEAEQKSNRDVVYDSTLVTLGALLHDVGDGKYITTNEDLESAVSAFLQSAGADAELAAKVQKLVSNVSWSKEQKDPHVVRELITEMPELAIVQDADRLDAIGAVGIGRFFAFRGAREGGNMKLQDSVPAFRERLEARELSVKTETGQEMARERTERLRVFRVWWEEEACGREEDL